MEKDLEKHHRLFWAVLCSKTWKGYKVRSLRKKVRVLCGYLHGSSYEHEPHHVKKTLIHKTNEYVVDEMFYAYMDKKHWQKYDLAHSLSTWILQYIYLNINNLLKRHKPRSIAEGISPKADLCDPNNINFLLSYEEVEDWLDMRPEKESPENILQHKELLLIAIEHFGIEDLRVILGMESKWNTIRDRKLNYDQYTKQLYLKQIAFKPVLLSNGYEFYFSSND
ncbi:hypothetical protein [Desulfogranum marinum]|uniref:hypothetical protein n=1 Tax=Desulfogranum marinum TaxID=453220 RepID=UPI001966068A|nr:hypothetical protein [Desulfogranum marinum]MBM9512009.1 hypothetical protein [Desulfogranum marinum]